MKYKIKIDEDALLNIQDATDWYNLQTQGLGTRFQKQVIKQINALKENPKVCAIRYADVRCLVVKKFPFMIHFTIDSNNNIVEVYAIIHTSMNPEIWNNNKTKE